MKRARPEAVRTLHLDCCRRVCWDCGTFMRVAYHNLRTVATLEGLLALTLVVRRCPNPSCARFQVSYRPEAEGVFALPHGEVGLDVIARIGHLRYRGPQSVPEMHRALVEDGVQVSLRSTTNLLRRYEELVALHLRDPERLRERLAEQGRVILSLDGLQPDVGHEVLWVLRDVLSGEILLARSLLSATWRDLVPLLHESLEILRRAALPGQAPVPIAGVVSDGQHSIRKAVREALPGVPHQLCHFHYFREAAKPIYEADRHAKKLLKKQVRGIRPIERKLERGEDPEAHLVHPYCVAVRSALTDDGRPPLCASGLKLKARLEAVDASVERVRKKGDPFPANWPACRS
jgi:hypothetical protein